MKARIAPEGPHRVPFSILPQGFSLSRVSQSLTDTSIPVYHSVRGNPLPPCPGGTGVWSDFRGGKGSRGVRGDRGLKDPPPAEPGREERGIRKEEKGEAGGGRKGREKEKEGRRREERRREEKGEKRKRRKEAREKGTSKGPIQFIV